MGWLGKTFLGKRESYGLGIECLLSNFCVPGTELCIFCVNQIPQIAFQGYYSCYIDEEMGCQLDTYFV